MPHTSRARTPRARLMPHEIGHLLGPVIALVAVVASGAAISAALPGGTSLWLVASSYMAPAGVAFAVHWWKSQQD